MEALQKETCSSLENTIVVVDDELKITETLQGVFSDEGYEVCQCANGMELLELLRKNDELPSLIMLDIWMPGLDGIEVLATLKSEWPELAVIMMSGHATISTAVKATQLGAVGFLEKPLDLERTLHLVRDALGTSESSRDNAHAEVTEDDGSHTSSERDAIQPLVFLEHGLQGKRRPQRTIASTALLYGLGLHSGRKSGLTLEPLPADSGIHFTGVFSREVLPAHVDYVDSTGLATRLKGTEIEAATVEHLLSALHAYGISNLLVKCNDEVPIMDGSSEDFCELLEDVGVVEQEGQPWCELKVDKLYEVSDGEEFVRIEPSESFEIHYMLRYPEPIGEQEYSFTLSDDISAYRKEIARARTFVFMKDVPVLQQHGLALGGRFNNSIIVGPDGPMHGELRYKDEFVRHKILDIIGDLYLLGRPICGKVTACMAGHSDNVALLKKLRKELTRG